MRYGRPSCRVILATLPHPKTQAAPSPNSETSPPNSQPAEQRDEPARQPDGFVGAHLHAQAFGELQACQ
jgi:hypothetical protein